jgi:hypothetical protein
LLERLRRLIPTLAVAVAALAMLGLSACGGGDSSASSESAPTVIKETFSGKKKIDSGKVALTMTAKLKGSGEAAQQVKDPVTIKISGPFESRGNTELPKLDLQLSATGTGQDFSAGAISTGAKGFISYQGKDYAVPDKIFQQYKKSFADQQRKDRSSNNLDLAALGIDPQKWLEDPKNEGEEDVAGAKTIHVSAGVNVGALLDDVNDLLKRTDQLGLSKAQKQQLPTSLSSKSKKQIQDSVKQAKVDVFTGKDDKTLRRLELSLSADVPKSLRSRAQGFEGGDLRLTLELADLNGKQNISAPANARSWNQLQQQLGLGALAGALGSGGSASTPGSGGFLGGGSSGGGGGSGISPSDRKRTERYLQCVQKAKMPEDVQACGSVLGK